MQPELTAADALLAGLRILISMGHLFVLCVLRRGGNAQFSCVTSDVALLCLTDTHKEYSVFSAGVHSSAYERMRRQRRMWSTERSKGIAPNHPL